MRSLWHKLNRKTQKPRLLFITPARKAQLTLFFMIVISIILAITMVAINIGKIARDKTHVDNSADSGALAAASVMAYAFNYVAEANKDNKDFRLEKNYKDFRTATSGDGGGTKKTQGLTLEMPKNKKMIL
jgi:hypothetical protein